MESTVVVVPGKTPGQRKIRRYEKKSMFAQNEARGEKKKKVLQVKVYGTKSGSEKAGFGLDEGPSSSL